MNKLQELIGKKKWYYVNRDITEANFPVPKTIQTEGTKLITFKKPFSSEEALAEIRRQGYRPANIYELLEYINDNEIEKGTYIIAFGSEFRDSDGDHRVPRVDAHSAGDFEFFLGLFGPGWHSGSVVLCFCDEISESLNLKKDNSLDTLTLERAIGICVMNGYNVSKNI